MVDEKTAEPIEETSGETTEEPQVEEQAPDLRGEVDDLRATLEKEQDRYKDLSARLTREQQLRAEWERYGKSTLPTLNQAMKSFSDRWEESPEKAVEEQVTTQVDPVSRKLTQLEAKQAEMDLVMREPELAKYREKAYELGDKHPSLTHTPTGIEGLYRLAEAEDLREQVKKAKSNGEAEMQKSRAYTESSSTKPAPAKPKKVLTPDQRAVAMGLGIKEDEYLQRIGVGK